MFLSILKTSPGSAKTLLKERRRNSLGMAIYNDIAKQNETLIAYLVRLNARSKTQELLSATSSNASHNATFASEAYNRWKNAMSNVKTKTD
jgi:hypothetical protein